MESEPYFIQTQLSDPYRGYKRAYYSHDYYQEQAQYVYASEADILNVALFGKTAKQWREANPELEGNIREHASIEQLLVLTNMEGINAELIRMNMTQTERLKKLNEIAILQLRALTGYNPINTLKKESGFLARKK